VGQALAGQLAGPGQKLDRPGSGALGPGPLRELFGEVLGFVLAGHPAFE
jgi:hypothetical protein